MAYVSTQCNYDVVDHSERGYVCTECHCFASFETVRIHTGVTVAILKACLSYSGTLDSCFLQAG